MMRQDRLGTNTIARKELNVLTGETVGVTADGSTSSIPSTVRYAPFQTPSDEPAVKRGRRIHSPAASSSSSSSSSAPPSPAAGRPWALLTRALLTLCERGMTDVAPRSALHSFMYVIAQRLPKFVMPWSARAIFKSQVTPNGDTRSITYTTRYKPRNESARTIVGRGRAVAVSGAAVVRHVLRGAAAARRECSIDGARLGRSARGSADAALVPGASRSPRPSRSGPVP
jgi:hypothetical protein